MYSDKKGLSQTCKRFHYSPLPLSHLAREQIYCVLKELNANLLTIVHTPSMSIFSVFFWESSAMLIAFILIDIPGKCMSELLAVSVPKYVVLFGQRLPQLVKTNNITSSGIFPYCSSHACKSLGVNWASAFYDKTKKQRNKETNKTETKLEVQSCLWN